MTEDPERSWKLTYQNYNEMQMQVIMFLRTAALHTHDEWGCLYHAW